MASSTDDDAPVSDAPVSDLEVPEVDLDLPPSPKDVLEVVEAPLKRDYNNRAYFWATPSLAG